MSNEMPARQPTGAQPRVPTGAQPRVPTGAQPRVGTGAQARVSVPHDTVLRGSESDVGGPVAARQSNPPHEDLAAPQLGEDPYIGRVVADRYKVISKLGEGGMGVVYLAEHVFIEKKVAVKILSEDFARKADLVARFMQEAKAASKIGHENIIDITDFGETQSGSVFFVMEYLDGHDLAHHIREGALPLTRVRYIVNQMCRALGAAHAKGIIHRDLKPENIFLIERNGQPDFVKILDFGIAKMNSLDEGGARLTRTGMIFGTPEYMSPEQAKGDRPDHRVDIYAAGCILYEMLTGDVPFHAETFMGVLTKHMFENPEPPSQRCPDAGVPPEVESVVLKALAKDRDLRFQTMKEMAVALESAGGDPNRAWGNEPSGVGIALPKKDKSDPSVRMPTGGRNPTALATPTLAGPSVASAEEEPKKRSSLPFIIVGASVAAVAVAGFVALNKPKPVEPPPAPVVAAPVEAPKPVEPPPAPVEPPKPVAPAKHEISLTSNPSEAEVFRGFERLGATPLTLTLVESTDPIELVLRKKGYKDQSLKVTPDRNRELVVPLVKTSSSSRSSRSSSSSSSSEKSPAVAAPAEEKKPEPKTETKPAGKLRDLKDPFAN